MSLQPVHSDGVVTTDYINALFSAAPSDTVDKFMIELSALIRTYIVEGGDIVDTHAMLIDLPWGYRLFTSNNPPYEISLYGHPRYALTYVH